MCGRFSLYAFRMTPEEFEERFGFPLPGEPDEMPEGGGYNIGPYRDIPVIFNDHDQNKMDMMYWQLIPYWSQEFKSSYTAFNTTIESFKNRGYKRELLVKHRCLVPANNFFEFMKVEKEEVNRRTGELVKKLKKVPIKFELKDEPLLTMGGIYSIWRDAEGNPHYSCSIITIPANELIKKVHPRMPFILTREMEKVWLDPSFNDFNRIMELIQPYPPEKMVGYVVSPKLNNPRNESPDLIQPINGKLELN